jgi:hypothetical protein
MDIAGAWAGLPLLLTYGGAVTAVAIVTPGMAAALSGSSFGWRQPVGLVVVAGALLAPAAGALWWVGAGVAEPLERTTAHDLPPYMVDAALRDPDHGVLVLRGTPEGIGYTVVRDAGARVGDDTVAADSARQDELTALVTELATNPTVEQVERLSRYGVEFIYVHPPAPGGLVGGLDVVSGLTPASAPRPGSRGWQLEADPGSSEIPPSPSDWRPIWLAAQALAVVAVIVLAAPSRRVRR